MAAKETHLTYRELGKVINQMNESQLDQPVQIIPPSPDGDAKVGLHSVYEIDTVANFFDHGDECRSIIDNKHHPEHFVMLSDWCPFSEEGDSYYTMKEDGSLIGNVTGEVRKLKTPDLFISRNEEGIFQAAYLNIQPGEVAETKEIVGGDVFASYNENGELLGIELLSCQIREGISDYQVKEDKDV